MICLEDSTFTNSNFVVSVDPNCISKSAATDSHFNSLYDLFYWPKTRDLFSEVDLELLQKLMHFDVLDMHL
jgi:hypothetical protein